MARAARRLSAGVVVVRRTPKGMRFLLLRAFRHWDFPKGLAEKNEQPLETAVREVEEETTLTDLAFDWGEQFVETGPYSRGKIARYYLARTDREGIELPVNPELGRPEHNEFRWVSYEEALSLCSPRLLPVVEWAARILGLKDEDDHAR